jgi:allophanate hydrolase subunit 1
MTLRILDAGDTALTIEFGDGVDRRLLAAVAALDAVLAQAVEDGRLPGIVETVPTFRSLTVIYDPLRTTRAAIEPVIRRPHRRLVRGALACPAPVAAAGVLWRPECRLRA